MAPWCRHLYIAPPLVPPRACPSRSTYLDINKGEFRFGKRFVLGRFAEDFFGGKSQPNYPEHDHYYSNWSIRSHANVREDERPEHTDTPYDQHRVPSPFQAPFNKNKTPQTPPKTKNFYQNTKDPPLPLGGVRKRTRKTIRKNRNNAV